MAMIKMDFNFDEKNDVHEAHGTNSATIFTDTALLSDLK